MDLWTVVEGQALSLLEGETLSDYPAVYPDLNGANQPGTAKAIEVAVHLKTPWWSEINQQEDKDIDAVWKGAYVGPLREEIEKYFGVSLPEARTEGRTVE